VAADVGLNTASITHYFSHKEDLAAACYLATIERLAEILAGAAREPDLQCRLRATFAGMVAWHRGIRMGEREQFVPLSDVRALDSPQREAVETAFSGMARAARALFDSPELASLDRRHRNARAHLLLEQLFWMTSWLYDFDVEDYPRALERACDIYLLGLKDGNDDRDAAQENQPPLSLEPTLTGPKEEFLIAATRALNQFGYWGASVGRISEGVSATNW
jgi:AcrR family transcriptional regulator